MSDYFKNDEYWKMYINKPLEEDFWIDEYKKYFKGNGTCLDLGCGIGQYSKKLIEYGYDVISADISDIALNKVKEFNTNVIKVDMMEKLPFKSEEFDVVFANLSIHYFSDENTKKLMLEIKRILKNKGIFVGSVNSLQTLEKIKDTACELEHHFYLDSYLGTNKHIRLFDNNDLKKYLGIFDILQIEERETIRFNHKKNYLVFFAQK